MSPWRHSLDLAVAKFVPCLRNDQALRRWTIADDDYERDVVIKTNTGGGKTIVGLLMLQCCLHEKKGPGPLSWPGLIAGIMNMPT